MCTYVYIHLDLRAPACVETHVHVRLCACARIARKRDSLLHGTTSCHRKVFCLPLWYQIRQRRIGPKAFFKRKRSVCVSTVSIVTPNTALHRDVQSWLQKEEEYDRPMGYPESVFKLCYFQNFRFMLNINWMFFRNITMGKFSHYALWRWLFLYWGKKIRNSNRKNLKLIFSKFHFFQLQCDGRVILLFILEKNCSLGHTAQACVF